MNIQDARIQSRRGTASKLAEINEVPLAGELVVETDTGRVKAGDGVKNYNSLEYVGDHLDIDAETWTFILDDEDDTTIQKKVAIWT